MDVIYDIAKHSSEEFAPNAKRLALDSSMLDDEFERGCSREKIISRVVHESFEIHWPNGFRIRFKGIFY